MGEPKFDERAKPAGRSAGGGAQSGGTTQGEKLRAQCRGKDFAQGEAALCPDNAVQMKPDPGGKGKPATGRKRVAELEQQNADLAVGLATREVHGVGERARHAMNDRRDTRGEQRHDLFVSTQVDAALTEARLGLAEVPMRLDQIEAFVEGMFVQDEERRAAKKNVEGAIEQHQRAQEPDLLDALGLLLDVSSALKSIGKIRGLLKQRSLAKAASGALEGPKAMELFEAGHDALNSPKGAFKSGMEVRDKNEKGQSGDTTTNMVHAVSSKIDVVDESLAKVESFLLSHGFGALAAAASTISQKVSAAIKATAAYTDGVPPEISDACTRLAEQAEATALEVEKRGARLQALVKARGNRPGESQLAKGTRGRRTFEVVQANPKAFSLSRGTSLEVTVAKEGTFTEVPVSTGYWLSCKDPSLRESITPFRLVDMPEFGRPEWADGDHLRVPDEVGKPLTTLLAEIVRPPDTVSLTGAGGRIVVRAVEWRDPTRRRQHIESVRHERTEWMGGP